MKAITIEVDSKGKSTLAFGLEVDVAKQSKYIKKLKVEGLGKDVQRVEMWSKASGLVMSAKKSKDQLAKESKAAAESEKALKAKRDKEDKQAAENASLVNSNMTHADHLKLLKEANQGKDKKEK